MSIYRWTISGCFLLLVLGVSAAQCDEKSETGLQAHTTDCDNPPQSFWDTIPCISWLSQHLAWTKNETDPNKLWLLVRLDTEGVEFHIPVREASSFAKQGRSDSTKFTISGKIGRSTNGKYPLDLTIADWTSSTEHCTETMELELELDKAWSGGSIGGICFERTVMLSRQQQSIAGLKNELGTCKVIGGE